MKENFILRYDQKNDSLLLSNQSVESYEFMTSDRKSLVFRKGNSSLVISVNFYLLDNIYFTCQNGIYLFSNDIKCFDNFGVKDDHYLHNIEHHGFLPNSATAFKNIFCLCSYLNYDFGLNLNVSLAVDFARKNYSLVDLINRFDSVMNEFKAANLNENIIIPLSGGMDSRLLLDRLVDSWRLNLVTFGLKNCGDVLVANQVVDVLNVKDKHRTIFLEDIGYKDILRNYYAADLFLPMHRLLYPNLSDIYSNGVVVSGLYGDVVFEDNPKHEKFTTYSEYLKYNNIEVLSDIDVLVVKAYDSLPNWEKLYRILLRSQKMTKQGVLLNNRNLKCFIPFLDTKLLSIAFQVEENYVYCKLVKKIMKDELLGIIHQSSLSYFCHSKFLRKFERLYFKNVNRKYGAPYYDEKYLRSIGISTRGFSKTQN
jgi:hypothetical protein